jgi:uncharacterized protein YkwD
VARVRRIAVVALSALCICAGPAGAPALGAHARVAHARVHHPSRVHHRWRCARTSSFHAGHRHVRRHRRGPARCRRHGARRHARHGTHRHPRRPARPRRPSAPPPRRAASRRLSAAEVGGQCLDAGLTPTQWNIERIRAATLCLVNRERAAHGESALQVDGRLQQAAQSHTESMAFGDYFEHNGPNGDTPVTRMRAAGYIYSSQIGWEVGENIGWGTLWEGSPRAVLAAWMASPGHRANILDPHFRDTAIGVSPHPPSSLSGGQAGGLYTQDFGVIIAH